MTETVKLVGGRNDGYKVVVGYGARLIQFAFPAGGQALNFPPDPLSDTVEIERYARSDRLEDGYPVFLDITAT